MSHITLAIKRLNKAYVNGHIDYPRVNNAYLDARRFAFHPHPPLKSFDEFSSPLRFQSYKADKDTILLHLNHIDLAAPSIAVSLYNFLDKHFERDLSVRSLYKEEILRKLEKYEEFLVRYGLDDKNLAAHPSNPSSHMYYYPMAMQFFKIELKPEQKRKRDEEIPKSKKRYEKAKDGSVKPGQCSLALAEARERAVRVKHIKEALRVGMLARRKQKLLASLQRGVLAKLRTSGEKVPEGC